MISSSSVSSSSRKVSSSSTFEESSSSKALISSSSDLSMSVKRVDEIAYDFEHAKSCNTVNINHVVYIQSEEQGYICTVTGYEPVEVIPPEGSSSSIQPSDPAWMLDVGETVFLFTLQEL